MTEQTFEDDSIEDAVDEFAINRYELPIRLELEEFESADEMMMTITQTAARSIAEHADEFDDDNVEHIATKVDFDETQVQESFDDDDTEYAIVETMTKLGVLEDEE